ncbi:TonB-dependent receptor [candidate division KSB1 bacterium]|nr:TonB-dependent receptor [candidate division KSB1 bacterium]
MNIYQTFVVILLLTHPVFSFSAPSRPAITVLGKVTDEQQHPLAYANIFRAGSTDGCISDANGDFSFTFLTPGKFTLVCTFMGYHVAQQALQANTGDTLRVLIHLKARTLPAPAVTVTASAFTAADAEGVTLSALDVVRTPGAAADLFWAIKSLPGVQQVEEGAGLFVRGGDVAETQVLLDGAILRHPYRYESPTGGFFGTFNPFLLKGTFFSSGGFSAQYGNSLSGVLAMESLDLPDRLRLGLGLGLAAESIYLAVPVRPGKFGFSLSGNHSNTKTMFKLNQCQKAFSEYPFSYDLNLNAIYQFRPESRLKFFAFREADRIGIEMDDPDFAYQFHGRSTNQLYHLQFQHLLAARSVLKANLAVNDFERGLALDVKQLKIHDRFYQVQITGETELKSGLTLRTGGGWYQNQNLIAGTVSSVGFEWQSDTLNYRIRTKYETGQFAHFFEVETLLPLGIQMITGGRGEYATRGADYFFDLRLACNYALTQYSHLSAAWGIYHQYPEPQYYDTTLGNPKLSAMQATHYIFGYQFQRDQRQFRLETYYKKYQRLLTADPQFHYLNRGYGYSVGVDVFLKNAWGPMTGWLAYSWLQARRKWLDAPALTAPYFDIPHNLTLVLNADLPGSFSLGGSYRYATGKPYTPAPDQYHQARVPAYQKLDLTFSRMFHFVARDLMIFYLGISNLLNRVNIFDYQYSADFQRREPVESAFGRSVYFGISYNW